MNSAIQKLSLARDRHEFAKYFIAIELDDIYFPEQLSEPIYEFGARLFKPIIPTGIELIMLKNRGFYPNNADIIEMSITKGLIEELALQICAVEDLVTACGLLKLVDSKPRYLCWKSELIQGCDDFIIEKYSSLIRADHSLIEQMYEATNSYRDEEDEDREEKVVEELRALIVAAQSILSKTTKSAPTRTHTTGTAHVEESEPEEATEPDYDSLIDYELENDELLNELYEDQESLERSDEEGWFYQD